MTFILHLGNDYLELMSEIFAAMMSVLGENLDPLATTIGKLRHTLAVHEMKLDKNSRQPLNLEGNILSHPRLMLAEAMVNQKLSLPLLDSILMVKCARS